MTRLHVLELFVALTALQRALELVHSRRNLARLSTAARSSDSRANWSLLVVLQVLWLCAAALEPAWKGAVAAPLPFACGLASFLAGEALRTWCIVALGSRWNARAGVDPAQGVVSTGPYRWIRHPNYLGVLLELVGLLLAGGAWWSLAFLLPAHLAVLARRMHGEDRLLSALPGYAAAMGHKRALVPRFRR